MQPTKLGVGRLDGIRLRTLMWFIHIAAIGLVSAICFLTRLEAPERDPAYDWLIMALLGTSVALLLVSLLLKRLRPGLPGFFNALFFCTLAAGLGPTCWKVTGSSKSLYPLGIGLAGMLLLYPSGDGSPDEEAADRESLAKMIGESDSRYDKDHAPSLTTLTTLSLSSPPAVPKKASGQDSSEEGTGQGDSRT